jgi:hypothetical protein
MAPATAPAPANAGAVCHRRRGGRPGREPKLAALGLIVVLLLSACQASIRVGIDVNSDGSGAVSVTAHLDHDAATSYAQYVRTSDLVKSGWKITGPTPATGGTVDFTATKPFANPDQAKAVVAELSGPSGPFRDLAVVRHPSFFQTKTTFQGTVDLTCGLTCFSDPQLQQALGGAANSGIDPSNLQADAGIILDRIFRFEVAARLPGKLQSSNAPSQVGNGAVWKIKLGQNAVVSATSRSWNVVHILIVVLCGLVVIAVVVVAILRFRRRPVANGAA